MYFTLFFHIQFRNWPKELEWSSMRKRYSEYCNLFGLFIGFLGTLLMAFAISGTKNGGEVDMECVNKLIKMGIDVTHAQQQCEVYFTVMKHPNWNWIGLFLLCAAFLIQIITAFFKKTE